MDMNTKHTKRKRGFSVIEAFVGISILLVGIVGPLTLVHTNLQSARFSRDQVTSIYLAQDAIETVRQMRDNNFLSGGSWLDGLGSCIPGPCAIDGDGPTVSDPNQSCDADLPTEVGDGFRLLVDRNTGWYGHNSSKGENSRFWRCVRVDKNGEVDARVTATVIFDTGTYFQAYETVGYISNWYPSN